MSKINDTELRKLLDEVAEDLQKAFDDSKETLVKGEESSSSSSSMAKDFPPEASGSASSASSPEASSASGEAPAAAPAPEASASGSGSDESASESSGSSAGEMGAPEGAGDPAAEQGAELTPEALQAEYGKLSPEELEMHIHAALAAKEAAMGAAGAGDAGAAMAPPAAAPVGAPADGAGPAMKAEAPMTPAKVKAMAKAEVSAEVEALRAQLKAQNEDIEVLVKTVTALGEVPLRKAIVSVRPEAPKAEAKDISKLTMKDVNEHLSKLTAGQLKKAERELINDFYERRVSIDKLAPLFENYGK